MNSKTNPPTESLRCFWLSRLALLGLLLTVGWGGLARAAEPVNVLFILTEDQGGHLSYLGTPGLETPHMDAIAEAGIYFDRAYVNYPVCSPSKAAIYTGTYCHTNGLINNTQNFFVPADQLKPAQRNNKIYQRVRVADRYPTLTESFVEAGYHTGVSGKLHTAPNEKFPYHEWFKKATAARTAKFLDNAQAAGKPFFFFCNIQAPHRPFRNSDQIKIGVDPADVELPAFLPDTPVTRKDYAEYLDYCEVADQRIGEVVTALEESGMADNTLIMLMGDHGPAYHRGKMTLYQYGLNVPLAFSGPGIPAGRKSSEMVSGVDIFPTMLELAGIEVPATHQGQSMTALVRGDGEAQGREHVFAEIMHRGQQRDDGMQERSVFDGRFKLIYRENLDQPRDVNSDLKFFVLKLPDGRKIPWRNRVYDEIVRKKDQFPEQFRRLTEIDKQSYGVQLPTFELYDTDADPAEFDNLAEDAAYAEDLTRLKGVLRGWVEETQDRFVTASQIN